MDRYVEYCYLIPLFPLIGAAISGFFGARWLKGNSHWPIWIGVGASAFYSIGLLLATINDVQTSGQSHLGVSLSSHWFNWINAGRFVAEAGAWIDPLTAVMLAVVCGIGFFICVFAGGYMKGEEGYFRFFAYLGLFIFAMTCLVMGNNFIMLYLGWEGVGLCSYLLIGYYYERPSARDAAKKAFLVNRIGDFGFGIGIMLCFLIFGTVSFFGQGAGTETGVLEMVTNPTAVAGMTAWKQSLIQWIPFCLMLGAFGKSAQFPLYVWLPDAMEGPTPVSALIHAATMVTAGVYMIARCGTLFAANPVSLWTVAAIGTFTAIFAATIALRQFDLKKVFAYSTVSQLGFMFAGVGVLAPVAGTFHLVTHAFFKALLFLSSGVVMHAMLGELDLSKMSGLKRALPKTRWLMLIGCLALAGIPPLSGFFSKDMIIGASWEQHKGLAIVLLITAFLTAYYTFRLYFRVFEGPEIIPPPPATGHGHAPDPHAHAHASAAAVMAGDTASSGVDEHLKSTTHEAATDHGHHNHEPFIMIFPLIVLAVGAVIGGLFNWHEGLGHFLGRSPSLILTQETAEKNLRGAHVEVNPVMLGQADPREPEVIDRESSTEKLLMFTSAAIALAGLGLAYQFHLKNRPAGEALPRRFPLVARVLENKYWVDEIYQAVIVEPLWRLGQFFYAVDRIVIDGIVWLVGFVPQLSGFTLKLTTQRGYLQGYAGAMAFGIVIILLIVFW
jgi:NADH-quinone oxidoreductase subunit L